MKKIILIFVLFSVVSVCTAQVKKKTFLAGLDLNFSTSTQTYSAPTPGRVTATSFSITPAFGYFVRDHFLIGLKGGLSITRNKDNVHGYYNLSPRTNTFLIGPYARYYKRVGEKTLVFLQAELAWGRGTTTSTRLDPQTGGPESFTDVATNFQTGIRPGFVYFISSRIGLEVTIGFLGYTRTKAGNDDFNFNTPNVTNAFGLSLNSSTLNFGFRYYGSKQLRKPN